MLVDVNTFNLKIVKHRLQANKLTGEANKKLTIKTKFVFLTEYLTLLHCEWL